MEKLLSEESILSVEDVPKRELTTSYLAERDKNLATFENWSEPDQVNYIEHLLLRMCHYQHGQINEFLTPMLQRDFITLLPSIY
jgi:F-box and WD-40 domain protein 1/11